MSVCTWYALHWFIHIFLSSLLHFGMVTLGDVCPQSIAAAAALLMSTLCPVHSAMRARVGERLPDQPLAV